jgi:hypothetical protein
MNTGYKKTGSLQPKHLRAMALVEIMVAMSVFTLVIVALVYTYIFCMRYDELVCSKLGASDRARIGFDMLTTDIRASKRWTIGSGSLTTFTPCGNATNQLGNAIQLNYTVDTNSWVRYFFNTNNATNWSLCRLTNGMATNYVVADSLTNMSGLGMSFRAEDYRGSNASDLTFKYVIVTTLEFAQYQYPLTKVGSNYFYNYYRIQFKTASHNYD